MMQQEERKSPLQRLKTWARKLLPRGLAARAAWTALRCCLSLAVGMVGGWLLLSRGLYVAALCLLVVLGGFVTHGCLLLAMDLRGPLRELTDLCGRISDGGYGLQISADHPGEIGQLTDAVNLMSEKICANEKLQSEFISSVSHELRTPLTAITGWSETMLFDEDIHGTSRRGLEIIGREAGRLTNMVNDLLEFTRIQDGRFKLTMETVDIAAEVEDAILAYSDLLRKENMEVSYTEPEELLPLINGDPERLRQVFLNILDNAAKYGKGSEQVDVGLTCTESHIIVSFRDYGPGIPADELAHVKEKFYKGSGHVRGNGIGLAVCDEIVTRHGGELQLANAEGGGAIVTVKLPITSDTRGQYE